MSSRDVSEGATIATASSSGRAFGYAAGLERRSEHPIAAAVLARADEAGVDDLPEPSGVESPTGKGIRGGINGVTHYAGKPALFEELGFDLSRAPSATDGGVPATDPGVSSSSFGDTTTNDA